MMINPLAHFGDHLVINPYEVAPAISPTPTNKPTNPTTDLASFNAAVDPTEVGSTEKKVQIKLINKG